MLSVQHSRAQSLQRKCADQRVLTDSERTKIFSNLSSLHTFHQDHLLPQLMERRRDWHSSQRISDVLCKLAPYLKLYTDYTSHFDAVPKAFARTMASKPAFAALVADAQSQPECAGLPLQTHLVEPVQRIMRYHLLLDVYAKNLTADHPDAVDTEKALDLCKKAAQHSDDTMKKMVRTAFLQNHKGWTGQKSYRQVLEVQDKLGSQFTGLVAPGRTLVKEGTLSKISARSGEHQPRIIYLFNDMLLVCSTRSAVSRTMTKSALRLRQVIDVASMQVGP